MVDTVKLLLLAVLQGITEFLPISSSGHLVIFKHLLGIASPGASLEVALHIGTLLSVLVFFRRRLLRLFTVERRFILHLIVGSIPAAIVGFLLKGRIEALFSSPFSASLLLIFTGIVLLLTRLVKEGSRSVGSISALLVGIGQAVAILPGVSRSGMTISTAGFLGVKRDDALYFAFLLFIPACLGAAVLELPGMGADFFSLGVISSILVSFVVGYIALKVLKAVLLSGRFYLFGIYCVLAGLASILYFGGVK